MHKPISPILSGMALVGILVFVGLKSSEAQDKASTLPAEPLQHIFDFGFEQTGNRTKVAFGLVTDYPIIQQHLGEIQIESPVGKGTEVTISLSLGEPL